MRSINNRPFLRRFKNKIHDGFFHLRVKLRCRLIHQKHIERAQQASSDIDPLAFPAGNCIQIFSQISCVTFTTSSNPSALHIPSISASLQSLKYPIFLTMLLSNT